MIAWALAAALLAPPQPFVSPTYAVQQSGGGLGVWVEETVVLSGVARSARPGGRRRYWLVEQRRVDFDWGQRTTKHRWIDGRTCPARPLAEWWRRSAQTLEICWRTEPPLVAGRPVQPTIAADAVRPFSP